MNPTGARLTDRFLSPMMSNQGFGLAAHSQLHWVMRRMTLAYRFKSRAT